MFTEVERYADYLLTLEDKAASRAVGVGGGFGWMQSMLTRQWMKMFGDISYIPTTSEAKKFIDTVKPIMLSKLNLPDKVSDQILATLFDAMDAGIEHAALNMEEPDSKPKKKLKKLTPRTRTAFDAIKDVVKSARKSLGGLTPRKLAQGGFPELLRATQEVRGVTNRVDQNVRWCVNNAGNDGVFQQVTSNPNYRLMWVAERDGCLHCLRLQGTFVKPGKDFPAVTFASKPLGGTVKQPPRHPRCRCTLTPYKPGDGSNAHQALQREAIRSVLRGWSDPNQSDKAKVDAAQRLLADPTLDVPKSVRATAQRAVKNGTFGNAKVPV